MTVRKVPGMRIANPTSKEIIYSPPEGHELILNKLANWETFVHALDGLDPLVRMAIAHYKVGRDRLFLNHRFLDVLVRDEMAGERTTSEPTLFG